MNRQNILFLNFKYNIQNSSENKIAISSLDEMIQSTAHYANFILKERFSENNYTSSVALTGTQIAESAREMSGGNHKVEIFQN